VRILGCDPGAHGGLALLVDGRLEATWIMPHAMVKRGRSEKAEIAAVELVELMREAAPDHLFIEQVGGMTGQSAPAAFNFGRAAAAPEYIAPALGISVTRVPPGTWKRRLNCMGMHKTEALNRASQMFPYRAADWAPRRGGGTADERCGKAEAALIAHYGWLMMGGVEIEEREDVFG
jgi:hypothetical protein